MQASAYVLHLSFVFVTPIFAPLSYDYNNFCIVHENTFINVLESV